MAGTTSTNNLYSSDLLSISHESKYGVLTDSNLCYRSQAMLCESGTVSQVTDGYLVSVLAVSILGEEFVVAASVLLQLLCCCLCYHLKSEIHRYYLQLFLPMQLFV